MSKYVNPKSRGALIALAKAKKAKEFMRVIQKVSVSPIKSKKL